MSESWVLVERRTGTARPDLGTFTSAAEAGAVAERERRETGVEFDIHPAPPGEPPN